jgi:hypothetical protein
MLSEPPHDIAEALQHVRNVSELRVTALTVMLYDYILTFGLEVNFIWKAPWGIGKLTYLLARYLPFLDITISMTPQMLRVKSASECKELYEAFSWFLICGLAAAEIVLTIRTWAICGSRRWLGVLLSLYFIATCFAGSVFLVYYLNSLRFSLQEELHPILQGCLITNVKKVFVILDWLVLFAYDAVNMGLMIMPAYYTFKQGTSNLLRVIVRDGLIYYVYNFVVALANITVISVLPSDYSPLIIEFGRILHSIFACRVVLHAREEAWKMQIIYEESHTVTTLKTPVQSRLE